MELNVFAVGPLGANCTLLWDENTLEAAVFDAGDDAPAIVERIETKKLELKYIFCTHAHFDHVNAVGDLKRHYEQAKICLHRGDAELYENLPAQGRAFGMYASSTPPVDVWLEGGEEFSLSGNSIKVLHTPGHSPGSVSFVFSIAGRTHIVCGDTVFAMGVGRTDLWGGSWEELMHSIKNVLFAYPDDTILIPGHGPNTTIGRERTMNPWLAE